MSDENEDGYEGTNEEEKRLSGKKLVLFIVLPLILLIMEQELIIQAGLVIGAMVKKIKIN